MWTEMIKLTDLIKACDTPVNETKAEHGITLSNLIESMSNEEQLKYQYILQYISPYVQKCNGDMRVMDGKTRLIDIKNFLDNHNVDINDFVIDCSVEEVESFNTDKLKQIRR